MRPRRWECLVIGSATLYGAVWWCVGGGGRTPDGNRTPSIGPRVTGRVVEGSRPVAGARVRFKGSAELALTDDNGRFELAGNPQGGSTVTVAKEGYLIAGVAAAEAALERPLKVQLTPLPASDHQAYQWVDPAPDGKSNGACGNCHQSIYDEWKTSGHARSAVNSHFQNLLDGSNARGEVGHGWGLAQEYPDGITVCWSCHAPSFEPNVLTHDPRPVGGVEAAGVHCDFCHKIHDTNLEQVGLTHGRFGYDLLRPAEGQLFFGPLDDVDRGEDAYSPLQNESRFCAACHEGIVFGVHVYSTYSEWLESRARREGRQCQHCHMSPSGSLTNIAPGSGGIDRNPQTLASHTFLPAGREAMLRRALGVSCSVTREKGGVTAKVRLEVHDVGHRLPTGFIDRQLLLVVEPADEQGRLSQAISGPRLPAVAGSLSGKPGKLFAKVLFDSEGNSPAPFWRTGVSLADDRLTPDEPDESVFVFSAETAKVRVRILYRRFWQTVANSKEWPDSEMLVYDTSFAVRD